MERIVGLPNRSLRRVCGGMLLLCMTSVAGCTAITELMEGVYWAELEPTVPEMSGGNSYSFPLLLYFPPSFKKREEWVLQRFAFGDTEWWVYPLGAASQDLLETTLAGAFTQVTRIPDLAAIEEATEYGPVLRADFEDIQVFLPLGWNRSLVEITFSFVLESRDGQELATWQVTGTGERDPKVSFKRPPSYTSEAVDAALAEAAKRLVESFQVFPEVRQALQDFESSS